MQAAVDALAGPVAGTNASATLQQVCYKPLGDDCATQSILQVRGPWSWGYFCLDTLEHQTQHPAMGSLWL